MPDATEPRGRDYWQEHDHPFKETWSAPATCVTCDMPIEDEHHRPTEPTLDADLTVSFVCSLCGHRQTRPGGLMFSAPDESERVRKLHVCDLCWTAIPTLLDRLDRLTKASRLVVRAAHDSTMVTDEWVKQTLEPALDDPEGA